MNEETEKLELKARRISSHSSEAMCRVARDLHDPHYDQREHVKIAETSIKKLTKHDHVKIVNSGNAAILSVMSAINGPILIPDQGGWSGFQKMADFQNLQTKEINTNQGLIEANLLEEILKKDDFKALFLTSFAGYMAEQPVKELYKVCEESGVLLVEDASGAIGDETGKLASGKHAHIIIASTGMPKIINVGNGGFVSTNESHLFKSAPEILKTLRPSPLTCAGIESEIKYAPHILSENVKACGFLKKNLDNILHADKRGINVCIAVENPKKGSYELRRRINVVGGNMITTCPRYERIKQPAICLEIKNIDVNCLRSKDLEKILKITENVTSHIK